MPCSTTTYAALPGAAATVSSARLTIAAQAQQHDSAAVEMHNIHYFIDVPIHTSDVSRWGTLLQKVLPPPTGPSTTFSGSGFLNAEAVLALPTIEAQRQAVHRLAPLPFFQASAVKSIPMTTMLKLRRERLPHRQRIPIYRQRMLFLDAVLNHSLVAVVGWPGSGRTLQVPLILSETEAFKRQRVVVVSANETAARLTAHRLSEERGELLDSGTVAIALPSQMDAHEGTSTVVTTADVLLRQLLCDPTLLDVGAIVFDDIHLRTESTEICFAILRELLQHTTGLQRKGEGAGASDNTSLHRRLHIVVNCLDEGSAGLLVEYFTNACRATVFSIAKESASGGASLSSDTSTFVSPAILYLEETVRWLQKCAKEGSALCRDPDTELAPYAEQVDVVTKVMAAAECDFMVPVKCRTYWGSLMVDAIRHYNSADRRERAQVEGSLLPAVVVVAPSRYSMHILEDILQDQLLLDNEETESGRFHLTVLSVDETPAELFLAVARRSVVTDTQVRWVLLCTPDLCQTVLPPSLEVGLVVDCARTTHFSFDFQTMANVWNTEYTSIGALRLRRSVGKLSAATADTNQFSPACMVIQLIPKSVLHSAVHRRQSTDPTQHIVFRLSFERYAQLYQVLQAREEAALCRQALSGEGNHPTVAAKIASYVVSHMIGVPASTSNRYEALRRVLMAVEAHLVAAGHVELPAPGAHMARLKPLGTVTTCVGLPFAVSRLLVLSPLFRCTVTATTLAAMWLVGDPFNVPSGMLEGHDRDATTERIALLREARLFFSRDSTSDIASVFNIYKMWLSMRHLDSAAEEMAFLAECKVPRDMLIEIEHTQVQLYLLLHRLRLIEDSDIQSKTGSVEERRRLLSAKVLKLPDEVMVDGCIQACVSAALYPNCIIPQSHGGVLLLDGAHTLTNQSTGTTTCTKRFGTFADCSLLSDADVLQRAVGKPYLYLSKTAVGSVMANFSAVPVLEQAAPLHEAAAVVFCGEGHERPKVAPVRCRGWTVSLTNTWRQTKSARMLPPDTQLPPTAIHLRPYDTIHARQVILSTDHNFHFTMRATTSRWLLQLREYISRHLEAVACNKGWESFNSAAEIAAAWEWWARRQRDTAAWLREERTTVSDNPAQSEVRAAPRLQSYYVFSNIVGTPAKVEWATPTGAQELRERDDITGVGAMQSISTTTYSGKVPSADVEHIFRLCVKNIASKHSREAEAKLLRDDPEMFSFLDPENEFHPYYLFLLRREAPDMEVLGDNIEELVVFLGELEMELRKELGIVADLPQELPQSGEQNGNGFQVHDVAGNEEEELYPGNTVGLQMEMAAVNLKKPVAPTFSEPPRPAERRKLKEVTGVPDQGDQGAAASIGKFTFASFPAPESNPAANGGTLMDKLLAMQSAGGSSSATSTTAAVPPSLMSDDPTAVCDPAANSTPTAADLLSIINAAAPSTVPSTPQSALAALSTPEAPSAPTTAELMALLASSSAPAPLNPLTKPPPPLPADAVDARQASVVAYPIPDRRSGNIAMVLAKSLGETLGMKVGPTTVVGNVARIELPNRKVEARALSIKSFTCCGKRVYMFKNDRIIDPPRSNEHVGVGGIGLADMSGAHDDGLVDSRASVLGGYDGIYPQMQAAGMYHQPPLTEKGSLIPDGKAAQQIGVFTDSDDDDSDGDDDSSSSSTSHSVTSTN